MLDTNICIYVAKRNYPMVRTHFNQLPPGEVGMSVVTYGELRLGAEKSSHPEAAFLKLSEVLEANRWWR
jgi:tRNA(fMet)-specific endonuclease VapC